MNKINEQFPDPLIDEVRERRRKLMEQHGFSLDKLYETIKKLQEQHPEKVIDLNKIRNANTQNN